MSGRSRDDAWGATWLGDRTRFALRSRHATRVELCLFDVPGDGVASRRLRLARVGEDGWALEVPGVGPGQLYGYRVAGPYRPQEGHRFNPAKLLTDPWARAITGEPRPDPGGDPATGDDLAFNGWDNAAAMPKCVVVDPRFDWRDDRPPRRPWHETVIYETHVRGMTMRHPDVDEAHRGRYLGLATPAVLEHLLALGVTAVELMPVHQIASEPALAARGLRNYWGYSTLGYFAPHAGYASGGRGEQVVEFKRMVRALHRAGLEVILDVVYNHTAELGRHGPTLSLRGLDNRRYYRLAPRDRRRYVDWTGCGNTLDASRAEVRDLILASLRYWVCEMHVDGFRFDLAPALGRDARGVFSADAPLLRAIEDDPALAGVKLIAEPWDLGPDGYRLGAFGPRWGQWNDRFRDAARRFWHPNAGARSDGEAAGHAEQDAAELVAELAARLTGSADLLGGAPSVDYVTAHDGFTLADLVSYREKRNQANGEDGRDGSDHNLSANWGHEGPSDDPAVRAARARARRNLLATLLLSCGVPMLSHGDELGRSQGGNNNPYCLDDETTWVDWSRAPGLVPFVAALVALRQKCLAPHQKCLAPSEKCLAPRGDGGAKAFGLVLGDGEERGVLLLNGGADAVEFELPADVAWRLALDTASDAGVDRPRAPAGGSVTLEGRSLIALVAVAAEPER